MKSWIKKFLSEETWEMLRRAFVRARWIVRTPILILYTPLIVSFMLLNIRVIRIRSSAVGHLIHDLRIPVKDRILTKSRHKIWAFRTSKDIANTHILKYLEKYVVFIRSRLLGYLMVPFSWISAVSLDEDATSAIVEASSYSRVLANWGDKGPLLALSDEDRLFGQKFLADKVGIKETDWFVCIHARESGYHLENHPQDFGQGFRNANLESYQLAVQKIQESGGYVIRVGDPTMSSCGYLKDVFDYAHCDLREARLDVYLFASCRFLVCSTSGVIELSNIFGVPALITNVAPLGHSFLGIKENLCMPKLYRKNGELLKFFDVLASDISTFRHSHQFDDAGIVLVDNTPEDICQATLEMLKRDREETSAKRATSALYQKLYEQMTPRHYTYLGNAGIPQSYLDKYAALIDPGI